MGEAIKQCSKCGQVKPIYQFDKDASRKDGLSYLCKECRSTRPAQKVRQSATDQKAVLKRAIATFGKEHQLQKIAEECSEFLQAYLHYKDNRPGSYEAMVDELADLFITAWQGRLIVGPKILDLAIDRKLGKLTAEIERQEDDLR